MTSTTLGSSHAPTTGARAPRLLLAEDDDDFRLMLTSMLERRGFRVTAVPDGRVALTLLASTMSLRFDGAILDVRMPGATGLEVLRSRRLAQDDVPIVLISGFADGLSDLPSDYDAEVLSKPFAIGQLVDAVRRRLASRAKTSNAPNDSAHVEQEKSR
ncbi:MAG: response regulator [Polyangiaceae bacterium]